MGFLKPNMPQVDLASWSTMTREERTKRMAQHIVEFGLGNPDAIYLLYIVKIGIYVMGGIGFAVATHGIDGWADLANRWSEPIVFQKVVLWSMLFEVLGLGCGFGPLTGKIAPPTGGFMYWLRTGTIRLAPWPNRIPFTQGYRRTPFEVVLYGALLVALVAALLSDGTGPTPGLHTSIGLIPVRNVAAVLLLLGILALRDKVIFLAARGEVYGALTVTFLFAGPNMIVAAKLVMLAIWLGAATSKLNRHFPFVVATMMSNSPVIRSRWLKRKFFRSFPDDLRPGRAASFLAHGGTVIEYGIPLVLFFSRGGPVSIVAAVGMVVFHLIILTSIPAGVPLEWNVFMMFGIGSLFVAHADMGLSDITQPWPVIALMVVVVGTVILGNLHPTKVSFLPGMRYYAGNWDTSQWFFTDAATEKIAQRRIGLGLLPHKQIEKFSGLERAPIAMALGYAFRGMYAHGRGIATLWSHAVPESRVDDYTVAEGEIVAGYALGWNFGDGHLHDERLLAAIHQRCGFEPGELVILVVDGQPIHRQTQQYRVVDAALGETERGVFRIADVVSRQPWEFDVPITVERRSVSTDSRPSTAESA